LPSHRVSVALANIPGFSSNILFGISVMQFDQDYYPGRRKRGKDYREDMVCPFALELLADLFSVLLICQLLIC
jgi:hypothetical protein